MSVTLRSRLSEFIARHTWLCILTEMMQVAGGFVYRLLRRACYVIGAFVLVIIVCAAYFSAEQAVPPLLDPAVLTLRLMDDFDQSSAPSLRDPFGKSGLSVPELVRTFDHAAADPKIKAVAVSIRGAQLDFAQAQELRPSLRRLADAGKTTLIYAENYDDIRSYYLASAFTQIWVQPVGTVTLEGFGGQMPFIKGLMDRVGVHANFVQRKEYKSAMENMTGTQMSPASREMLTAVYGDVAKQVVGDIATGRKLGTDAVWAAIDHGVLTGREAVAAKLIDRVDHADVAVKELIKKFGHEGDDDSVDFISVDDYRHLTGLDKSSERMMIDEYLPKTTGRTSVALVNIDGTIFSGEGGGMIPGEGGVLSAEDIASAIDDAVDDDDIRAIVVRINSPGGSATASETIRYALVRAHEKGKPVIVSMASLAASGGYWIATAGDHIFAQGTTLTGSIGVVGGKFDVAELSKKLDVTWDGVMIGKNAGMFSPATPFGPSELARINVMMDDVYAQFVDLVAKGRKMKPDAVEKIAKGRVWTGSQGRAIGLVDEIGGLRDAVSYTAKTLNVTDAGTVDLVPYPAPRGPFDELVDLMGGVRTGGMSAEVSRVAQMVAMARNVGVYAIEPTLIWAK